MTDNNSDNQQYENTYVIDSESGPEMARLLDQDRILTEGMGGVFAGRTDLTDIFDVLDIGCGPGGWVHEVAHLYPEMEVTGIDISKGMIEYARAHAQVRELPNAHFYVMNALRPLGFPDASFDLVNMRTIVGFVLPEMWSPFLAECRRVLRPGGIIQWTEGDMGLANTPAQEKLAALATQAMYELGRSLSPTGRHLGILPLQGYLLRQAGFAQLQRKAHIIDYSYGEKAHEGVYQDFRLMYQLGKPFLLRSGLIEEEEFDRLYEQALAEMQREEFCGFVPVITTWGVKS